MNIDAYKDFAVTVYGDLEPYNAVLSKARCRVFYKYKNRNGSYITDEFAEKLISTIIYAPIKGIYNEFTEDYNDHGKKNDEGRIYGIVPENYNFAWEDFTDSDGITRTYACVDVLLYTGIYKEVSQIIGKSQSMELYVPSIKGDFQIIDGQKYFVYSDACFLGLQVLGDEVEPCFEGSAFFTLYNSFKQIVEDLKQYSLNYQKDTREDRMVINFKLSDNEKFNLLFDQLNSNFNEDGNWTIDYSITDIYDLYAIAYNYNDNIYERVYYEKNDSDDTITIIKMEQCFIVDVNENEKKSLETIQALNGGNYEKAEETFEKVSNLEEKNSQYSQKIEEQETIIATLTSEKTSFEQSNTELKEQLEQLENYKLKKETEEKEAILSKYAQNLDSEIIEEYRKNIAEYSIHDLDKELAFKLVETTPSLFTKNNNGAIPKPNLTHLDGVEAILEKYKK